MLQVFELLPSQPLPRCIPLKDAKSFSLGAYSHGVVGVQTATRTHPQAAAVFCQVVTAVAPNHPFSTITVHEQVHVSCHRDSQNFDVPKLVVPLTFFTGGALFVYDEQGSSEHGGCRGHLLDVQNQPWIFNAKKHRHEVLPHEGVRVTLVAYSVDRLHLLSPADKFYLFALGFRLPTSVGQPISPVTRGLCDLRRLDANVSTIKPQPVCIPEPSVSSAAQPSPQQHTLTFGTGPLIVELCAGSAILSAAAADRGYSVMPVDCVRNRHATHVKVHDLDPRLLPSAKHRRAR